MTKLVYLFSLGHFSVDWCQGAIPALLPYFIAHYGLSYQAAAALVFANVAIASVMQPLFGYFSDRVSKPWFIPLGVLLPGLSITAIGFSSSYWAIFSAALVIGVGSALFHPEAALMENRISGERKGEALGIFAVGGNAGFAVGPLAAGLAAYSLGIEWLAFFGVFNLAVAALTLGLLPAALRIAGDAKKKTKAAGERNDWPSFGKLSVAILCRAIAFTLLNTFIPIYWINVIGTDEEMGSAALSALFTLGACVTYFGGRLSDKFSRKRIIIIAFAVMIPTMLLLTHTVSLLLASALLVPAAVAVFLPYSPIVVLGQTYLAKNAGFASGVTLGLSTTLGGLVAPIVGWAADTWGLVFALQILWIAGIGGLIAGLSLPREGDGN